jgi:uncharacterized protein (TIGR00159 family)
MGQPQLQQWLASAQQALSQLRLADVLDVLLVAALVYGVGIWLRRARARFMVIGMAVLALLFGLSRALDMYVSQALFEAGLPALLIALLIIFQEDLRRGFERIVAVGAAGRRKVSRQTMDVLVEATEHLARGRVGALIVLRGREPLERHLNGGVTLHGKLSGPLLYSLFDPHSAGHDGAVVIEGDQVRSFAVHLPLSAAAPEAFGGERGTRHAAALGLSEQCDALVIVVSEERGAISVARDGELWPVSGGGQLGRELSAFASGAGARRSLVPSTRPRSATGTRLWRLGALAIAAFVWLLVAVQQQEIVVRTLELPVTYRGAPADWLVRTPQPATAAVTLSAPAPVLARVQSGAPSLSIDLGDVRDGAHRIELGAHNLELPPEVAVQRIEPDHVRVVARKTRRRVLPVHATLRGKLPAGLRLAQVSVEPERIEVLVVRELAERMRRLPTEPIELGDLSGDAVREVGVVLPDGARLAPEVDGTVRVHVHVRAAGDSGS